MIEPECTLEVLSGLVTAIGLAVDEDPPEDEEPRTLLRFALHRTRAERFIDELNRFIDLEVVVGLFGSNRERFMLGARLILSEGRRWRGEKRKKQKSDGRAQGEAAEVRGGEKRTHGAS